MENKDLIFEKIIAYEKSLHKKNQKRIKTGIQVLLIIPLIFLTIMFRMESNKVIFLALWIISLFVIALYLIFVEYMDYELQVKLREFGICDEDEEIDGLIYDRMDVEKILKAAEIIQESFSLEEAENEKEEPQVKAKSAQDYAKMRKERAKGHLEEK